MYISIAFTKQRMYLLQRLILNYFIGILIISAMIIVNEYFQ